MSQRYVSSDISPLDQRRGNTPVTRFGALAVACLALPVAAVIMIDANLYNGWRQMYFLAAPFLRVLSRSTLSNAGPATITDCEAPLGAPPTRRRLRSGYALPPPPAAPPILLCRRQTPTRAFSP